MISYNPYTILFEAVVDHFILHGVNIPKFSASEKILASLCLVDRNLLETHRDITEDHITHEQYKIKTRHQISIANSAGNSLPTDIIEHERRQIPYFFRPP